MLTDFNDLSAPQTICTATTQRRSRRRWHIPAGKSTSDACPSPHPSARLRGRGRVRSSCNRAQSCRAQSRRHTRTRCSQPHDRAHGRLMRHTPPIQTGYPRYLPAARSGHRRAVSRAARRALREHSRRPGHAAQKCAAARPRTQPLEAANRAHQDRVPAITWLLPLRVRAVPPLGSLPRPCAAA